MASVVLSILSSNLFYIWFTNYSACRDLTLSDINSFPIQLILTSSKIVQTLSLLAKELIIDLKKNSVIREYNYATGLLRYQEFYMRKSKPIIDEIDRVLAQHYEFTDEEFDFIINYDIKYRMGRDSTNEEEE